VFDWRRATEASDGRGVVIVITGPGRSGTSFLALLYRELGFDPGGTWMAHTNAGLESGPYARVNTEMASDLGTVVAPRRGTRSFRSLERLGRVSERRLPPRIGPRVSVALTSLRYRRNMLDLMDWTKLDSVVARYGERLQSLSRETEVVKDPRFCWTLQAWLAAGASISAVVLALRPLDAMVESRVRAGMIPEESGTWAKNNFAYGIGLVTAAVSEYRVPLAVLRFPDFLNDPLDLHRRLPLPEERSWDEFHAAFVKVHDASLVHDRR
jgi:hypothetical protein